MESEGKSRKRLERISPPRSDREMTKLQCLSAKSCKSEAEIESGYLCMNLDEKMVSSDIDTSTNTSHLHSYTKMPKPSCGTRNSKSQAAERRSKEQRMEK